MPDNHWGSTSFFGNQNPINDELNTPQSAGDYWPPMQPPGSAMFQHRGSIPGGFDQQPMFLPNSEQPPHGWSSMRSMSVGDASLAIQQFQQGIQGQRQTPYMNAPYPYHVTQQSSNSSILESPDHELPIPATAPVIVPSQPLTLNSQAAQPGWNAFTDQSTPVAEHNPVLFGAQWLADSSATASVDENVPTTEAEYVPFTPNPG
jgi:hypothetical protein